MFLVFVNIELASLYTAFNFSKIEIKYVHPVIRHKINISMTQPSYKHLVNIFRCVLNFSHL